MSKHKYERSYIGQDICVNCGIGEWEKAADLSCPAGPALENALAAVMQGDSSSEKAQLKQTYTLEEAIEELENGHHVNNKEQLQHWLMELKWCRKALKVIGEATNAIQNLQDK